MRRRSQQHDTMQLIVSDSCSGELSQAGSFEDSYLLMREQRLEHFQKDIIFTDLLITYLKHLG